MSYEARGEYVALMRRRYRRARRPYKTRLLNEMCEVCGYDRKYAIKLLNGKVRRSKAKRGRKSKYDTPELVKVLKDIWMCSEQPCSKRLQPALGLWLRDYEKHYGRISEDSRQKLQEISPATIDRLLAPFRVLDQRRRNCGTKPGTLLKNQIPIRTGNEDIDRPGYLEADTVAHCGGSMSGEFIWSITYTDINTGWTANRAVWNKGYAGIVKQTQDIEKRLPFAILGFDCDNGSEFLNHHLTRYFLNRKSPVGFTRSRPYRKNDNAHVEQKNWTHVRELLGYDRLDNPKMIAVINDLYTEWGLLNNFFLPSLKLKSKVRIKSRYKKTYEEGRTPYERLLSSGILTKEQVAELLKTFESLDPYEVKRKIERRLRKIAKLKTTSSPQAGPPGDLPASPLDTAEYSGK